MASQQPRQPNSTNPRPGMTTMPRSLNSRPPLPPISGGQPRRPAQRDTPRGERAEGQPRRRTRPARKPAGDGTGGSVAAPVKDEATKQQMNQTFSVALMASPVNVIPFPLSIPLGVMMLLGPAGTNQASGKQPAAGSAR